MREIAPDSPEARRLKTSIKMIAYAIAMVLLIALQAAKHFETEQHHPRSVHSRQVR